MEPSAEKKSLKKAGEDVATGSLAVSTRSRKRVDGSSPEAKSKKSKKTGFLKGLRAGKSKSNSKKR